MKILPVKNYNINFCSAKSTVKKADDIQRTARLAFPIFSTTYIDTTYRSLHKNREGFRKTSQEKIVDKIDDKIGWLRSTTKVPLLDIYNPNRTMRIMQLMKSLKVGNCGECSAVVMAALAANGYYKSYNATFNAEIKIRDKETGKIVHSADKPIDHEFIMTYIPDEKTQKEIPIIIDSWMGFSDTVSGAIDRYKSFFAKSKLDDLLFLEKIKFSNNKSENKENSVDMSKYETTVKLRILKIPDDGRKNLRRLGEYTRKIYPELVLDK